MTLLLGLCSTPFPLFEITRPEEKLIANQPAVRLDYQPWQQLRGTFKFSGWSQKNTTVNGTIPGFNDTRQYKPVVRTMAVTINVEYVGQHSFNTLESVDINGVDFGAAFQASNQDPTLSSTTPGAAAVQADQMRAFRGYSSITQQWARGWRTFHSIQLSFNRRFRDGLSFGFNDTMPLTITERVGPAAAQR